MDTSPAFIPGLALNEAYYREAVRPILDVRFPGLQHAAALIGYGSDVLGYDTPVSRDHMWGPRLLLFLAPEGFNETRQVVDRALRESLPVQFRGYSTHFGSPDGIGVRLPTAIEHGPVDHLIFIHTLRDFFRQELNIEFEQEINPADWLSFAGHRLLSVTGGRVYHDSLGLEAVRARLAWYPHDLWLYLLAAQWQLISQEEAFVGRTAAVGDEIGSRVVTARLVERLMRLCFLMERRYAPYSKWFGTAFGQLTCAAQMGSLLEAALSAADFAEREEALCRAYSLAAQMHNALQVTPALDVETQPYYGRPYRVIFAERFSDALREAIRDPEVRSLPPHIGGVNQFLIESSDALQNPDVCRKVAGALFEKK